MSQHRFSAWTAILLLAGGTALAAQPASDATALDRYLDGLKSLRTAFTQTVTDARGTETEAGSGTLVVQRPGKFRWDYQPRADATLAPPATATSGGERIELLRINLVRVDSQPVTRRPGLDQVGAGRSKRRAQALNGAVQRAPRTRGRLAFPQHLGQVVQADHAPAAQQQRRQQHPLPWRGHGHIARAVTDH